MVAKISSKGGRVNNYVQEKRDEFFWAGCNDFLNETYLTLSYCVCINTGDLKMSSTARTVNNVFLIVLAPIIVFGPIIIAYKMYKVWQVKATWDQEPDTEEEKEGG